MATLTHPAREANRVDADTRIDVRVPEKFVNEPSVDWSNPENQRRMRTAIEKVRNELGREYDLVIGGRRIKTAKKHESINPAHPTQVVGIHQEAGAAEVAPAMEAALKAFETWSRTSWETRITLLFRTAQLMRERKYRVDGMAGVRGGQELPRG